MFDTQPTPFDVRFSVLGIPVRVHPLFWLIMALLGDWTLRDGVPFLLLWVGCGFVSILVHELGHAVLIRRFGSPVEIVLVAFGGAAVYLYPPTKRWKRIAIALAGPAAGFALLGLVVGSHAATGWAGHNEMTEAVFTYLFLMNLIWNLFNLLPIWPLDGGKVCREVCGSFRLRNPDAVAFQISFLTAGGLAAVGVLGFLGMIPPDVRAWLRFVPGTFMTIWFVMFAVESYQLWQQSQQFGRWDYPDDDTPPWRR